MCGIFCFFASPKFCKNNPNFTFKDWTNFNLVQHRGPDNSNYIYHKENFIGFHRLCINGGDDTGDQPFQSERVILVCNGEIYNYKDLIEKHQLEVTSNSDCEVILRMYERYGFERMLQELDGVFAIVLYDKLQKVVYIARDYIGIRPLFIGFDKESNLYVSSEMKAITNLCDTVKPFRPNHYWNSNDKKDTEIPYVPGFMNANRIVNLKMLLETAVYKRIMTTDRNYGFFLSGGLDSSLIVAIANKINKEMGKGKLYTFSIGWDNTNDIKYASKVAEFCNTYHTTVPFDLQKGIDSMEQVIIAIESFDVTTVRASVPMWLLSKWIKENTDITVVFSGEGADEIAGGYLYHKNAPNFTEWEIESKRLLSDLYMYDVLRSDRCTAAHGLELRVPFLDKDFLYYVQNCIVTADKHTKIEKEFLRKTFASSYLPNSVLWRQKEAFSDGIGHAWVTAIKKYVKNIVSDDQMNEAKEKYPHCTPKTKEAYYYRMIYEKYYTNREECIPYFWMPRFQKEEIIDPSATVLESY